MSNHESARGRMVIAGDAIFEGRVSGARVVDVYGELRGEVTADRFDIHPGGRAFGTIEAVSADIGGQLEGSLAVRQLCAIRSTGDVTGKVRYGRLSMAEGAQLEAHLRNIPPEIGGDLEMTVERGGATRITIADLSAFDPDDHAADLTFEVSNPIAGHVARVDALLYPLDRFTQLELERGEIAFASDGSATDRAGFDVVVRDASGASSGPAKTMRIAVTAAKQRL